MSRRRRVETACDVAGVTTPIRLTRRVQEMVRTWSHLMTLCIVRPPSGAVTKTCIGMFLVFEEIGTTTAMPDGPWL